jgi:glycosyltransferase involved in cell wall biosynthesis
MHSRDEARKRLGVERYRRLILFFGSIKPSKGLDHLIGAFAAVAAADPQARLLIAHEPRGVDPERCRAQIDLLGLEGKVLYRPGYVEPETVPDHFAASDLVALPYVRIYQSGVLHLVYRFGKLVVAARIGGFVEDVAEGRSGLLVPPGDEPALASAIGGMLASPSRLARMAE